MRLATTIQRTGVLLAAAAAAGCGGARDAASDAARGRGATRGSLSGRTNAGPLTAEPEEGRRSATTTTAAARDRDLQASCKYGCESLPCEGGCQSAFARCDHDVPLCFTNATEPFYNATVQWGWSNPIACAGGSIECDLWVGAVGCNTTASASQRIGTVTISTDDSQVQYEITDHAYRISSVQVYFGTTEAPLVDGFEYSISPGDYTVQNWFHPKAKGAIVYSTKELIPGMYLIAHANVCPTDSADEIPEAWVPGVNNTDPMCPILAPDLCSDETSSPESFDFSNSNLFQPAPSYGPSYEPTAVADGDESVPLVDPACPFKCDDLSCEGGCVDAFAYCPNALCLGSDPGGSATWGHSNPINCTGGSMQCELWTGDDCNHTNGELIGQLYIDTDEHKVTYNMNDNSAWKVSSARIYVGSSPNFEPYVQQAWFNPSEKTCTVEMYQDIHAGVFVIVQALVCPTNSGPADLATHPPNDTVPSCPIPPKVPCPSSFPTSNLATAPPATSPGEPTAEPLIASLVDPLIDLLVDLIVEQSQTESNGSFTPPDNLFASPSPTTVPGQTTPPNQDPGVTRAPLPRTQRPRAAPTTLQPTSPPSQPTDKPQKRTSRPTEPPTPLQSPPSQPTEKPQKRTSQPTEPPTPLQSLAWPTVHPTEPPTESPAGPPTIPPTELPTLTLELTGSPREPKTLAPAPILTNEPTLPPTISAGGLARHRNHRM